MNNITKEHIYSAIEEIKLNPSTRKGRASTTYDLIYEGNDYPPKLVISIANRYATGEELDPNTFAGGQDTLAFKVLRENGFEIRKKNIKTRDQFEIWLKEKHTEKSGAPSSYLRSIDILSDSFYKNNKIDKKTLYEINNIDLLNNLHKEVLKLQKDKNSYIYYSEAPGYGDNNFFSASIKNYIDFLESTEMKTEEKTKENLIISFHQYTKEAGLIFSEKMVARFVASLCTKPFVICSGLSGSGKTKLAQSFVQWISKSDQQYRIVPVGADWTNREPLLGYPNALNATEYISPDNGVLDLMLQARDNKKSPYFLILDEMNLSHVERYFADFLSAMESKEAIPLHSDSSKGISTRKDSKGFNIPNTLHLPSNLFIIGTVNIDETTYMFSPKVLDRANAIEFRITDKEIENYLNNPKVLDMKKFVDQDTNMGFGASMSSSFLNIAEETATSNKASKALVIFFKELKKAGAEFGYRSASEINRLVAILEALTKDNKQWDKEIVKDNDFIDIAIMQKLLPKLHGSRSKLCPILLTLAKFCIQDGINDFDKKDDDFRKTYFKDFEDIDTDKKEKIIYPISFEKIARMHKNAIDNGFTSYAEA